MPSWWENQNNFYNSLDTPNTVDQSGKYTTGVQLDYGPQTGTQVGLPTDSITGNTSWWDRIVGSKESGPGVGGLALNTALGAGKLFLGAKQYGLAKKDLAFQKRSFSDQFNLQKQNINRDIMDKGVTNYHANPNLNVTPEEYYNQNKV